MAGECRAAEYGVRRFIAAVVGAERRGGRTGAARSKPTPALRAPPIAAMNRRTPQARAEGRAPATRAEGDLAVVGKVPRGLAKVGIFDKTPTHSMNPSAELCRLPGSAGPQVFAPGKIRALLENEVLPGYIPRCRWFGGKAREPRGYNVREAVAVSSAPDAARLFLVEIDYATGAPDTYLLPLQTATGERAEVLARETPNASVARFREGGVLFDAVHDADFRAALYALLATGGVVRSEAGEIAGVAGGGLGESAPESRVLAVEQSNSSIIYGERVFLKLYRRLEEGVNPDAEILRFLGKQNFPHVPPFCGALEFRRAGREPQVLALATGMVPNDGDAWSFTLRVLTRQLACMLAGDSHEAQQIEAAYLARAGQLGQRTGALHLALATDAADADFAPEPLTSGDFAELAETVRTTADQVLTGLAGRLDALDPATRGLAAELLAAEPALRARIAALTTQPVAAAKTRTHGDYHLGQVLNTGTDFVIIDFEGEPAKPLAQRRRKRSPLRDVAGMLRSFHYAAHSALGSFPEPRAALGPHAERWHARARAAFLSAWIETTTGASFLPAQRAEFARLLDAFLLEKALYEIAYELNNRPAWLGIPLRGAVEILRRTS